VIVSDVHFRFSPNILVRLGEELNQGSDQSILELIKNSYDADAKTCTVELINTAEPGGSIIVSDDGDGMSDENIKNSWLVLGKSSKNSQQTTKLGRTPSGSKGLGRLAALRMGRSVHLESTLANAHTSSVLDVNWDKFDNANTVEDVELTIQTLSLKKEKGTKTELNGLRSAIRSEELKRLARVVLLLTDPFEDKKSGFKVDLKSKEFEEIKKLLGSKYFDSCEYHLSAKLDDNGIASAQILDWQGKVLHTGEHIDLRYKKDSSAYLSPGCKFDFWAFLLKKDSFTSGKNVNITDVRDWLKHFGGVHVYQDDVRVSPYGGGGDDWLGINLIRTQNPEERPSTNNSIGKISLSNKGVKVLVQKTDRSGFIEDDTFTELKLFAVDSLEWMARWRLAQAERRRQGERASVPAAATKEKAKLNEIILEAPPRIRQKMTAAFDQYAKSRDKEADNLRKEIQLYRTLSTAGITAATFAHESHGNPLKVIELATSMLEIKTKQAIAEDKQPVIILLIEKIRKALDALSTLSTATLSLVRANKRRIGRVEINSVILQIEKMMRPFYTARDTSIKLSLTTKTPFLRCSEAALESILTNLLNNALNAFRRESSNNRIIEVLTSIDGDTCVVTVADSGPGITQHNVSEIWLPGITSDPDGTGLGLTIVKDTVKDLGGDVQVTPRGELLGGAEFRITLPIIGS
jgi:signal transduction histidine kinase